MTLGRGILGLAAGVGLTITAVAPSFAASAPLAPQSVVATPKSETSITLSWTNPNSGNNTSTTVRRGPSASGPWTTLGSPIASRDPQTFADAGLSPWTVYYYQLQITSTSSGTSAPAVVSARTLDTTPPADGTASAAAGQSTVTVSWSAATDAASGLAPSPYRLVYATGTYPASCGAGTTIFTGSGTSFTHTGLTNGTTYFYRVCASDNAGNTSSGASISAVPRDMTAPTGSMIINANAAYTNTAAVTLTLSASDSVGVTGYYVSTTSTPPLAGTAGWAAVTSTTSLSTSAAYSLPPGDGSKTVYAWYKDLAGNVSATASDAIVLDQTAPVNGTLTATPSSSQVSLSWSGFADVTSGLATTSTYKLVFSTGAAPASCATGTQLLLGTATTYAHTGVTNGTTYFYRVCAFDKAGNTSTGVTASATPQPADATAPAGSVTINGNPPYATSTSATLNLSATDAVGIVGYYVSTNSATPLATAAGWTSMTSTTSFSSNVAYTLAAGDGTKTVYVWYKDAAGNVSVTASDSIVLDQTAPANGTLTASPGNAQVSLAWSGFSDAPSGLASANTYKLVFGTTSPSSCAAGTQIYTGTAQTFVHTGRANGTTYFYRVCATDNAGNVSTGATATATPQATDTTAPTGSLTINTGAAYTAMAAVTLNLSATDGVGVTGYYVSPNSTPPSATAAGWTAITSTTSYTGNVGYTASAGDGTKTVYVWYKDAAGNVSAARSDTIVLDQTSPTNGTAAATPGSGQVTVSWSGFTDATSGLAAVNTYKLVYATGAAPASCSAGTQLALGTATSFTHTGLTNGTGYFYRICAFDAAGNVSSGATAGATPQLVDTVPPDCSILINGGAAYTKSTAVTLALAATDNVGVTGYYVSTSSATPLATAAGWTGVASTTNFSSNAPYTLTSGDGARTLYIWYKDAAGNVSAMASDSITLDQTAPANGTLTASPGSAQISLTWSGFADATSGLASTGAYKLVYSAGGSPASCAAGTPIFSGSGTSYTHTGLVNGTAYYYRLCATDNAGNASTGATASASPTASDTTPPSVPSLTASAASCNQVNLSWTPATDNVNGSGLKSYRLSRGGAFLKEVLAPVTSTTDNGLSGSTAYTYTVSSVDNANNQSAPSNTAITSTPACDTIAPASPTNVRAWAASCTQLGVMWAASTDNTGGSGLKGYNVYRNGVFVTQVTATSFLDTVPAASATYSYTVAAVDNAGNQSNPSAASSASLGSLVSFRPQVTYATGTGPYSVAVGDVNGDRISDLVVANNSGNSVSVLLGKGDGTFWPSVTYATGTSPRSVAIGDLNGDGKLDVVTANTGSNNVSVLLGRGDGTLQTHVTYPTGTSPTGIALGDLNRDGVLDVAVSNFSDATVSVLRGNGNGTFQAQTIAAAGTYPVAIAVADLDGDGDVDIVTANSGSNDISVLLGQGTGAFLPQVRYATGSSPKAVVIGDLDGNGVPDVAVTNTGSATLSILLGNGNGTFQTLAPQTIYSGPSSLAIGNPNRDGVPDLAVTSQAGNLVSVYSGTGTGTFQASGATPATGIGPVFVTIADLTGDGGSDLVVANFSSNTVSVILNACE